MECLQCKYDSIDDCCWFSKTIKQTCGYTPISCIKWVFVNDCDRIQETKKLNGQENTLRVGAHA